MPRHNDYYSDTILEPKAKEKVKSPSGKLSRLISKWGALTKQKGRFEVKKDQKDKIIDIDERQALIDQITFLHVVQSHGLNKISKIASSAQKAFLATLSDNEKKNIGKKIEVLNDKLVSLSVTHFRAV